MKKQITRSDERMHTQFDWLNSRHSFSFGRHVDPDRMGFGPLRVVNDDIVAPGKGFGTHPHRDMEIVSLVLGGTLQHRDSMGNGRVIQTGDIQYMSAGSGVEHSEFNPSEDQPAHFLQIWIQPRAKGLVPRYADQPILGEEKDAWKLLLSANGRDGSIEIRQDAELRSLQLTAGHSQEYRPLANGRGLWLFVINGKVSAAGEILEKGDSLAIEEVEALRIENSGQENAELLLFDLRL